MCDCIFSIRPALNQPESDAHKREFAYGGVLWGDPECKVIGSSE